MNLIKEQLKKIRNKKKEDNQKDYKKDNKCKENVRKTSKKEKNY